MRESFVFLAAGFEEIEAVTVIDVLRRAGMPVKTVSITSALQVTGAHGITMNCDVLFDNTLFREPAWLILPGGMPGATNLRNFAPLEGLLRRQASERDGKIAAICAAPAEVLGQEGLLKGKKATCYPGFEEKLGEAVHQNLPVVVDGKFVTANGPASAMRWALAIVEVELGRNVAESVGAGMLFYPGPEDKMDNIFG